MRASSEFVSHWSHISFKICGGSKDKDRRVMFGEWQRASRSHLHVELTKYVDDIAAQLPGRPRSHKPEASRHWAVYIDVETPIAARARQHT